MRFGPERLRRPAATSCAELGPFDRRGGATPTRPKGKNRGGRRSALPDLFSEVDPIRARGALWRRPRPDVDGRRAREGRVKDRAATGGAGERGRRFCRLARQNWGDRSSLRRAEQSYDRTSSRGENRGPQGRVRMPAAAGQSGSPAGATFASSRAAAAAPLRSRAVRVAWRTPVFSRAIRRRECI